MMAVANLLAKITKPTRDDIARRIAQHEVRLNAIDRDMQELREKVEGDEESDGPTNT